MNYQDLEKRKALIVDDEGCNRLCITYVLKQEGWEVNEAENGREAIEKVLAWQPHLLILDNQMPELTGVEVYKYLQLHGIKLAVVLISADTDLEKLASEVGIAYYLPKPFELEALLKTVDSAYENSFN
ncbi:Response regulator receiver domain protein CheY [Nostoc sp. NIES-3756]|uniref:response regulator n=1 Tax=Nostoc sp. NIES-3756 TaxID=1751286 RepID=UPI0007222630|nr:response regulator [Nostoc sp. NIES-3756]BAT53454.1 Response regulator receiver domain protein CheY [Nostoc sp. NIES-3756]BAY38808.1 response regulator receiver domain protein [Nostoc sp. NIES-2111]